MTTNPALSALVIGWVVGIPATWLAFLVLRDQQPRRAWLWIPALAVGACYAPSIFARGGHFGAWLPAAPGMLLALEGGSAGQFLLGVASIVGVSFFAGLALARLEGRRRNRWSVAIPGFSDDISPMKNQFTAHVQREGEGFVALCPEAPAANGQGRTRGDSLRSLASAIELVFEDRRAAARVERQTSAEETLVAVG